VVKENEFVRRFHAVTASDELADVERRRNAPRLAISGLLTAASVGVIVFGIADLTRACDTNDYIFHPDCASTGRTDNSANGGAIIGAGALLTAAFGTWFTVELVGRYDGSDSSHGLTDRDAHLYVERYNRSLLRKTVREVERSNAQVSSASWLTLAPFFGPTGLGVRGRF
jgi:hypothetical protein